MDDNRRSGIDRRKHTGLNIRLLVGNGVRKTIRRQEDRSHIFWVDNYSAGLFLAVFGILFLCVIDAILTLFLLNHGAYEVNPLMAYLLNIGPSVFIIAKYGITVMATFCLFSFRNVVVQRLNLSTYALLNILAGVYVTVVAWELYLVHKII
jgi:hypothetical protein